MKEIPSGTSVFFKLARVIVYFVVMSALGYFIVWAFIQVKGLSWIPVLAKYLMPFWVTVSIVYLLMWIPIFFFYNDFKYAFGIRRSFMLYKEGKFEETVEETTHAIKRKSNSAIAYFIRARAYSALKEDILSRRDLDMAEFFGINVNEMNF